MAAVDVGTQNAPNEADLDDLFDYDVGDVFRDVDTNMDIPSQQKTTVKADGKENVVGLGIDEEIKVAKKRVPVPKLDEGRLLGPAGIPKLRRITKERLKFKGKGHEYSDVARLLNVYQLWLDELYPRAKFADGLAIIEKLGHRKRMHTMRREWINEGKPKEAMQILESTSQKPSTKWAISKLAEDGSITAEPIKVLETSAAGEEDDENFYAATPKQGGEEEISERTKSAIQSLSVSEDEDVGNLPPEDDLDALLAEDQSKLSPKQKVLPSEEHPPSPEREENFEDEMEAMVGMEDLW